MTKTKFKGHDWTELSKALGIKNISKKTDGAILDETRDYLIQSMSWLNKNSKQQKKIANIIREFLIVLHKVESKYGYQAPIWQGLLNLTDDETLIVYTGRLLEYMWT